MQGSATRSVAPVCDVEVIAHSAGHGTSTAFSVKVFVDSDTGTPSFTSANAALRLAGVIRLSVPSSSSRPQRPQFDNSVCQASYCASLTRGRDDPPWEATFWDSTATSAKAHATTETAARIVTALIMISSLLQAVDGRAVSGNVRGDTHKAHGVVRQYSTSGASYSVVFVDSHCPFFILLFE